MKLIDVLKNKDGMPPKNRIVILGVNPIISELTRTPDIIFSLLKVEENLEITIIYESENENFNQSLFYDKDLSKHRIEFDKLQTHRNRLVGKPGKSKAGFYEDVLSCFGKEERVLNANRLSLYQNNLRHNQNIILVDDVIWHSITTLDIPTLDMYTKITNDTNPEKYRQLNDYISFLLDKDSGRKYLSGVGEELIELYDMNSIPRGIYPRKSFYSTDYQRRSIWAFVFNRNGELLLHQRSTTTKDNRGLWDKSAGGHVDLTDSSTLIAAKRELIEELFLPEAEFTRYMQAELGDIIDFGEWNIEKRPEKHFKSSFDVLDDIDWVGFRASDKDERGRYFPMTIRRKSPRKIHIKHNGEECIEIWNTRFMSDVYLFVAPEDFIDTEEQMKKLFEMAEKRGAASSHKLCSIDSLIEDVEKNSENYTDDMIYMCSEKKWILLQFSESIKYIFQKEC